jgi:hypothetical protein
MKFFGQKSGKIQKTEKLIEQNCLFFIHEQEKVKSHEKSSVNLDEIEGPKERKHS